MTTARKIADALLDYELAGIELTKEEIICIVEYLHRI
jgi:hypothetical protein